VKSISDVVGASGLAGYAEIALLIFFAVFMAVLIRVVFSRARNWEHAARLPLDDADHDTRTAPTDVGTRSLRSG
jgi:cbb3-type cytochrome oxidase subunit 3